MSESSRQGPEIFDVSSIFPTDKLAVDAMEERIRTAHHYREVGLQWTLDELVEEHLQRENPHIYDSLYALAHLAQRQVEQEGDPEWGPRAQAVIVGGGLAYAGARLTLGYKMRRLGREMSKAHNLWAPTFVDENPTWADEAMGLGREVYLRDIHLQKLLATFAPRLIMKSEMEYCENAAGFVKLGVGVAQLASLPQTDLNAEHLQEFEEIAGPSLDEMDYMEKGGDIPPPRQ